jgi:type II secretory pathway pseudopilin PulG
LQARASATFNLQPSTFNRCCAFTLVEVMVVMTLLSLIVIALMGVFSSTQSAFRASITQTDVLESGRAAMDLITGDLRAMAPSGGTNNGVAQNGAANFYVNAFPKSLPLVQPLTASGASRTNVQQYVYILSRGNNAGVPTWYGTGYAVWLTPSNIYSLYRFSTNQPVAQTGAPYNLIVGFFNNFLPNPENYSHLFDGVIGFRIHAFDIYGHLIDYDRTNTIYTNAIPFSGVPQVGEVGYGFYSNAVPAAVEIEMATLEDRTLQRAESRPGDLPAVFPNDSRTLYLQQQAGNVHIFRQRIAIPNVDPAAYQ